jgi:hypothetical protein
MLIGMILKFQLAPLIIPHRIITIRRYLFAMLSSLLASMFSQCFPYPRIHDSIKTHQIVVLPGLLISDCNVFSFLPAPRT